MLEHLIRRIGLVVPLLFGVATLVFLLLQLIPGDAAVFVAGALGLYPVGQRFLLFLLPLVVICLAEGITRIGGVRPPVVAIGLLVGLVALILVPVVGTASKRLVLPPKGEEIESLLREVETSWQPGDVLYLYPDSQYAFRYYAECHDCGDVTSRAHELWPSHPTAGGQPQTTPAIVSDSPSLVVGEHGQALPESLAGKHRVWLLYTHFFPRTEQQLLDEADSRGKRVTCSHGGASLLCLYDFS